MADYPIYGSKITKFEISVLKDTNWYAEVNDSNLDTNLWGKDKGCEFVNSSDC